MFPSFNFKGRMSGGLVSIYSSRMILNIGNSLTGIFLPIFLFLVFGNRLSFVLVYYLICYSLYFFTVALGAKFSLNKLGIKKAIIISTIFGAVYFVALYLVTGQRALMEAAPGMDRTAIFVFLSISLLFTFLQELTYWVPVHTEMSELTDRANRAKQLAVLESCCIAFNAVGPLLAGWILAVYGYNFLFIISVFITLLSIVPLFYLPKSSERFSWSYRQTWKELFSRKRRKAVLAFMGDGAENVVSGIVWPIFIWEILKGNFFSVGAISSAIVASTVILELAVGKYSDNGKRDKILHWGTALYALGWLLKIFIDTAFQIFIVSTYHSLVRLFTRTPFDAMLYEHAADQGHYVDEYSVIHEMALMAGRILIIFLMLMLVPIFGIGLTFILAALSTLLMNLLIDEKTVNEINKRI